MTPHQTLNSSKGVVYHRDLLNFSTEEILEGMRAQVVIDVKRFKSRRNGTFQETGSYLLTFDRPKVPFTAKAGFNHLEVREYIPAPMHCFKCQRFGHTSMRCDAQVDVCACWSSKHEGEPSRESKNALIAVVTTPPTLGTDL